MVEMIERYHEERESEKVRGKQKKNRQPSRGARGVIQPYDEEPIFNPHLKAAILEVIENQIRNGDPPETQQTLERLLVAGCSRKQP